jgi:hypothetical protein
MACRTGCKTKDHGSYAECCRDGTAQVAPMWTNSKTIHSELASYADARKQGVQPVGTKPHQVEAAMRVSEAMGKPFDAGVS